MRLDVHEARVRICMECGSCAPATAMHLAAYGACPLDKFGTPDDPAPEPPRRHGCTGNDVWGPLLWKALHEAAGIGRLTPAWLAKFVNAIPCVDCQEHAVEYCKANPLGSDPRRWSWGFHNAVNARIDKPAVPYEAAADRWGWRQ